MPHKYVYFVKCITSFELWSNVVSKAHQKVIVEGITITAHATSSNVLATLVRLSVQRVFNRILDSIRKRK